MSSRPVRPSTARALTWLLRLALLLVIFAAGAATLESYARSRHLDRRRARATAVKGRRTAASYFQLSPDDWDLPYLPRVFELGEDSLVTAWGECRFDHPGRTVLVLGDSTTRQASGHAADASPQAEAARSWAALVAETLPADVQVCVVAEDGYHPTDYASLVRHLGPLLSPDLIVVLLCSNDLGDISSRVAVAENGWTVVYEEPAVTPIYPALWQPWLWTHSEAYRFASWRIAELTGDHYDLRQTDRMLRWQPALQEVLADGAPTVLAYLPHLSDQAPGEQQAAASLARLESSHAVTHIQLSPPWEVLRREEGDDVHMSDRAHTLVAAQLGPVVRAALEVDASAPADQP